jgi:CHAD domain-containing protein
VLSPDDSGGQPRSNQLHLDVAPGVAPGLVKALEEIASYAIDQQARLARDPVKAVHEYRKSIRRARAMLRLLRGKGWRRLDHDLRDAVRATSILRDRDVLLANLAHLPPTAMDTTALREVISHERAGGDPAPILASGAEILRAVPGRWAKRLDPQLSMKDLRRRLADAYRRAQRTRRDAANTRGDEDVHRWRKRVKELRYQLELLGAKRSGPSKPLHTSLVDQATLLGEVTDDVVMRDYVQAHADELGNLVEPLSHVLRQRAQERLTLLLDSTQVFYGAQPKTFARQARANLDYTSRRVSRPEA